MRILTPLSFTLACVLAFALMAGCGSDEPASPADDSAPTTQTSEIAAESVEVGYKVGARAPDFSMSLLDGRKVTPASLASEGKPTFLYFHATF